jgi:hypothetical protein
VALNSAGDYHHVGVALPSGEMSAEAFDTVVWIVKRLDFQFAGERKSIEMPFLFLL